MKVATSPTDQVTFKRQSFSRAEAQNGAYPANLRRRWGGRQAGQDWNLCSGASSRRPLVCPLSFGPCFGLQIEVAACSRTGLVLHGRAVRVGAGEVFP